MFCTQRDSQMCFGLAFAPASLTFFIAIKLRTHRQAHFLIDTDVFVHAYIIYIHIYIQDKVAKMAERAVAVSIYVCLSDFMINLDLRAYMS